LIHRSNISSLIRYAILAFLAWMLVAAEVQAQTVVPATGGSSISADNTGSSYVALTGPAYWESSSGNVGVGTIVINAPAGFVFDTGAPSPTVLITRTSGNGGNQRNINGVASGTSVAVASVTTTQITFTVTSSSTSGVINNLTWQNVRVRPTAGTPLASGNITKTGTATMTAVTGTTNFGTLTEVAGAVNKLVVTMPGQTFTPGTGNIGSPTARTAGTQFGISSITAADQFFNVVASYAGSKSLSYAGPGGLKDTTSPVSFASGQALAVPITLHKAETTTLTVSDGTITGPTSSSFTVNAGSLNKLQVLLPGESAVPGSATGKQGSPTAQTAGTAFNVTVRGVDADWNLASSTDVVHLASTDANAALPSDAALAGGTKTFSVILKTAGSRTITASDTTNALVTSNTSASVAVNAGPINKLQLLVPGETAAPGTFAGKTGTPTTRSAGSIFSVTVNSVDAYWNVVSSSDVVSLTSSDTYASLPANAALSAGSASLFVALKTAGSATLTISDVTTPARSSDTSPSIPVTAGVINRLQILLPGESSVPGSLTGKTGTPDAQNAGTAFSVTVNSVDSHWNSVSSSEVVHLTSTDGAASLPSDAALVSGTRSFTVTLNTAGAEKVVASDVTTPAIALDSSSAVTVNPAGSGTLTPATGGGAISADSVGGTFTSLVGPLYEEASNGNVSAGTIVLNVASGFEFDTGSPAPTVLVQRTSGSGPDANNINGVPSGTALSVSATSTQLTLTVTSPSGGGVTNSLTWQNVRVRPVAGYPLASGYITNSGTATVAGVSGLADLGTLTEVAGAAAKLVVILPGQSFVAGTGASGSPASQTAGSPFTISSIRATDQYFNTVSSYTGGKTLSYSGPGGIASYTTSVSFTSGVSATTLSTTLRKAETTPLSVSDGSITGPASSSFTVVPAAFARLLLLIPGETFDPGTATGTAGSPSAQTAGSSFPVTVNAVDSYWNLVTATDSVSITSSDGYATLPADTALVAGSKTFSVTLRTAGTSTITASDVTDPAKTADTSPSISVNPGAFAKLQILVPGETADPGSPTGKTGTPSAEAAGTPFSADVNAVDADWNVVSSVTDVVHFTSTDGAATLPADSPLAGGTGNFSVTLNTSGTSQITVSDVTNGGIGSDTSPLITVANVTMTAATGGEAISADNAGGSYASLTGPVYGEATPGDVGTGTVILNAPAGFEFDTGAPQPTVLVTRLAGGGGSTRNINGVASGTSLTTTVSSTQITLTITSASNAGVTNSLTWQNIRVRPAAGTPLATGTITKSGTSVMTGVTGGITNFGTLQEVPGTAVRLVVTLPGETFTGGSGNSGTPDIQTSGVSFNITSLTVTDQFYNVDTSYSGSKTIGYTGPGGSPSYTTSVSFTAGESTTPLATTLTAIETTTISASDGSLSGPASSSLTVVAPTKTWDGGAATSNWGDGANWNPDGVPGPQNDVQLTSGVAITVNVAAAAKNLTLNNGSLVLSIQSGASIAVSGNLSILAGTLATDEAFPTVSGTTTISGGDVSYTLSSGSQTVDAKTYNNLSLSGGTKTLGGNVSVSGDLTISSGIVDLGTNSLNRTAPGGTMTLSSGATLLVGGASGGISGSNFPTNFSTRNLSGIVEFNRAGDQIIPALAYADLTLSSSGTKTIGSGVMTISGAFSVTGSATVDATTNSSTVSFTGGSGQTVRSMTYYNLTITGAVAKSAAGDITVVNSFSNASTFSMGTNVLSIGGTKLNSGTMQFGGTSNGVVFSGGIVEYDGSSPQTITSGTYGELLLTGAGAKTFNTNVTVLGNVTLSSGSGAIVDPAVTVSIIGDLDLSGSMTNNGIINLGN